MNATFRKFRVIKKTVESKVITSFYLEPTDGNPLWPVKPGQYLTLKVPTATQPIFKTYSVSSDPDEGKFYRITVKRETRPSNAQHLPDGIGSTWLHDMINIGSEIEISAPRGTFVLDKNSTHPAILLSGGVGITPLLSMLHSLAKTKREVYFLHACENSDMHAMRKEVQMIAKKSGARIRIYFIYAKPRKSDIAEKLFNVRGFIDKEFLQSILPIDSYDTYMCGPTPFMVAMYRLLQDLGINKNRICYEFFGKANTLEALTNAPEKIKSKVASRATPIIQRLIFLTDPDAHKIAEPSSHNKKPSFSSGDIVFQKSNVSAKWDASLHSLLDLAEKSGLTPDFSCRAGICNTCKITLIEGEVEYFGDPLVIPPKGKVLICCARPKGRVVLDI